MAIFAHLKACDSAGVSEGLTQALARRGAEGFVHGAALPLVVATGEAWHAGTLAVHQEHLLTQTLQRVLGIAAQALQSSRADRPDQLRFVLATYPGETRALGLAMLEVVLAAQGCACVQLGSELPHEQLAGAAQLHAADGVALSFSSFFKPSRVVPVLAALREALPAARALWVGGGCTGLAEPLPPGVRRFTGLGEIGPALADLRKRKRAA